MNSSPLSLLKDSTSRLFLLLAVVSLSFLPLQGSEDSDSESAAPELTEEASLAIQKGLKHLLKTQRPDGSWDAGGDKKGGRSVSTTSLALMAFMASAQFPGFGKYGKELEKAKDFLMSKAKSRSDGYLGTTMYEHGLATLALSEIWGMTKTKEDDDAVQEALEKAVDVIKRSQNPGGGWRYQPVADGGEDSSVTAMVFIALASARQAGIMVENEIISKFQKYCVTSVDAKTGGHSYAPNGNGGTSIPCTAGMVYAAQLAGLRGTETVNGALRLLKEQTNIFTNAGHYYYCHYYAIQAMVQAGDKEYAYWYPKIRDALVGKQNPDGSWSKKETYSTPIAIIILSTPHRYIPIYQR